jgi:hypothetical protein
MILNIVLVLINLAQIIHSQDYETTQLETTYLSTSSTSIDEMTTSKDLKPVQLIIKNPNYHITSRLTLNDYNGKTDFQKLLSLIYSRFNLIENCWLYDENDRPVYDVYGSYQQLNVLDKPANDKDPAIAIYYRFKESDINRLKATFAIDISFDDLDKNDEDGYIVIEE